MKSTTRGFAPSFVLAFVCGAAALPANAQIPPPSAADVGDPDSFGRSVIYLGTMQSPSIAVRAPCEADTPSFRCTNRVPDPGVTVISETNMLTMRLPAGSTR